MCKMLVEKWFIVFEAIDYLLLSKVSKWLMSLAERSEAGINNDY
jgi:hypothetical protein